MSSRLGNRQDPYLWWAYVKLDKLIDELFHVDRNVTKELQEIYYELNSKRDAYLSLFMDEEYSKMIESLNDIITHMGEQGTDLFDKLYTIQSTLYHYVPSEWVHDLYS